MKKEPTTDSESAAAQFEDRLAGILALIRDLDATSSDLLRNAYRVAFRAHAGQQRLSGEPFIIHGLEVGRILAELGLDPPTIAAGLLHDVLEDTGVSAQTLEREFGSEISLLVQGLTELGKFAFRSPEHRQIESARRMLISMARDIRVIFIKLADRLHNMRTLEFLPPERIESIARETLEIYAPLAHRLGIQNIRSELEDLAFRHIDEEHYNEVKALVKETASEGEAVIDSFRIPVEKHLLEAGIEAKITSRIKHLYSIWRKMVKKEVKIEGIYDILSMRIITMNIRDCYHVLEIVHSLFMPIHDRFKDYIAAPKSNMYQSLHTTVMDATGHKFEVQIRTEMMNNTAERGLAAHWIYKEGRGTTDSWQRWLEWYRQTLDYQLELTDPSEFLRYLKTDLFQTEIYVFTPTGELKRLPAGSTPIDFAFSIHSDIGDHCTAAKVNGRLVPLNYTLTNGDRVEIVTSPRAEPHEKWLNTVKTSRARSKIRHWLRNKTREQEARLGRELIRNEAKRLRRALPKDEELKTLLADFGTDTLEKLYAGVAHGTVSLQKVIGRLYEDLDSRAFETPMQHPDALREYVRKPIRGVRMEGLGDIMIRYAKCCQPLPGDAIVGIITRGRGVSVHRVDCANASRIAETERVIRVEWDAHPGQQFLVSLMITARHRDGLVAEIKRRVRDMGTAVRAGRFEIKAGELQLVLVVGINDLDHMHKVISEIKSIGSVYNVYRAV